MEKQDETFDKQKEDLLKYYEGLDSHHRFMLVAVAKLMADSTKNRNN